MIAIQIDVSKLAPIAEACALASKGSKRAVMRAVNYAGDKAHTRVARALGKVMGTGYGKMTRSLDVKLATEARTTYTISASGAHLSLASFNPRQTKKGVVASPWGIKRLFPRTFIIPSLGGQVFKRTHPGAGGLVKLWGPSLPVELLRDESLKAFNNGLKADLTKRVEHELARLIPKPRTSLAR